LEGVLSSQINIPAQVLSGSRSTRRKDWRRRQPLGVAMKELPPAAGNEWRHLFGATFTSVFVTMCKRTAGIDLLAMNSVWVALLYRERSRLNLLEGLEVQGQ
jgi:hypothetical protein